jgi:hypothetical protein
VPRSWIGHYARLEPICQQTDARSTGEGSSHTDGAVDLRHVSFLRSQLAGGLHRRLPTRAWSGGYGAILLAEKYPHVIDAVAAISPAIWTSYGEARNVNQGAYASASDFAADDAVTHASSLAGIPIPVASGNSDPFHPGVQALAKALPPGSVVVFSQGCHTGSFFVEQEPPSLLFLTEHLAV